MTNNPPNMGDKLREAMRLKGVTQAAVARQFNVSAPTVSTDWLKKGRISKRHYPMLVQYFELPFEWWFGAEVKTAEEDRWPTPGEKLGVLFDSMPEPEQRLAWPWVVRMICINPALRKAYMIFPADNHRVAKAFSTAKKKTHA